MCGIAGIFNYRSPTEHSMELSVRKMLSVIRHRGPDESGMYLGENVGLGNVRLSIIDLKSGQQPVSDESENYWIVYNGEIFNYKELRTQIENKGIRLKTQCDTEVVVQMYAMYGASCLHQFNGQFAFCIWDKKNKQLFLARDRVGIRPLFYWNQNNSFAFCSEIKGLFTLDRIDKKISTESLSQVFTYWTTISPNTPFENVYELPPGHYMTVNEPDYRTGRQKTEIKKYWSLDFPVKRNNYSYSLSDSIEELNDLLKDAVRIRLRADVPVAAYLSGGLDSSLTTSLIKEINPEILNTFSIGFKEKEFDETSYQQEAAKYFNTNHTAFECTSDEIAEQFLNTIWHTEFPVLRTSPTPMLMLSKKVRERNIKVVVTGEGADEFFAGYNIFKESKIRNFWAKEPDSKIRYKLLSRLYPYLPMLKDSNSMASKMFFGYKLTDTNNPFYSHLLRWHNTSRITNFFSNDIADHINKPNTGKTLHPQVPENFMSWSELARSQFLESSIFMSGYLLSSQGDRVAMANSVEGRYPFLDYRVIEFSNQLPDHFKLNCLQEKFLLKKMSIGKIPSSITNRSKQPYRAPISSAFISAKQPAYISEMLSGSCLQSYGLFNPKKVALLFNKMTQQENNSEVDQMALAGILSTQLLYMLFIKNPIIPSIENLSNFKIITESTI